MTRSSGRPPPRLPSRLQPRRGRAPPGRSRPPRPVPRLNPSVVVRMRMRAALAALLLASTTLAGCATTGTSATTAPAQCAAWRAITYSSQHDTAVTVRQVRVHNRTGEKLGCWR